MKPFAEQGNFTIVHNVIFDVLMRRLDPAPFKILMAIIRRTKGFHKDKERISIVQLMQMTRLSKQGVFNSIEKLGNIVLFEIDSRREARCYSLNKEWEVPQEWVNSVDDKEIPSGQLSVPLKRRVVHSVDHSVVNSVYHHLNKEEIKKDTKERKKRIPPSADSIIVPDWIPLKAWEEFKEHRKKNKHAPITRSIAERLFSVLAQLRDLGHEPAAVLNEAVDRNWIGIKVDWIHKGRENNGKIVDEPKGFQALRDFQKLREQFR